MRGTTKESTRLDPWTIVCVQGLLKLRVLVTEGMNVEYGV